MDKKESLIAASIFSSDSGKSSRKDKANKEPTEKLDKKLVISFLSFLKKKPNEAPINVAKIVPKNEKITAYIIQFLHYIKIYDKIKASRCIL